MSQWVKKKCLSPNLDDLISINPKGTFTPLAATWILWHLHTCYTMYTHTHVQPLYTPTYNNNHNK